MRIVRQAFYLVGGLLASASSALAQAEPVAHATDSNTALGAGLAIAIAALGGALGQGKVAAAALESIGRNPGAAGQLNTPMILGLALIESLVIYAFVIAMKLVGIF